MTEAATSKMHLIWAHSLLQCPHLSSPSPLPSPAAEAAGLPSSTLTSPSPHPQIRSSCSSQNNHFKGKSDHVSTCSVFQCLSSHLDTTQTPDCDLTGNKTWLLPSPLPHPTPPFPPLCPLPSLSLFYAPQTPKLICHLLFVLLEPSSPFICQVPSDQRKCPIFREALPDPEI